MVWMEVSQVSQFDLGVRKALEVVNLVKVMDHRRGLGRVVLVPRNDPLNTQLVRNQFGDHPALFTREPTLRPPCPPPKSGRSRNVL